MAFGRIGKYTVMGKIGQGAVGEVYRAHDPLLNREVAIKMNSSAVVADAEVKQRFLREAQSAALLNHPNIVTVYDFGEEHDRVYMAMELLEGTDLSGLIENDSLGDLEDRLDIMEQVCEGVAFAHAHGVIHRDVKPANIHIQPDRTVRIIDFGLARLRSGEMTSTGMVLGTPHYMSPEQVQGQRADTRSDVFSVGAVFYEVLTRRRPFAADSLQGILFRVINDQPQPMRDWNPAVPELLVQFVGKAMAKDATDRFQDGGEMRRAFAAVRGALASPDTAAVLPDLTVRDQPSAAPPPAADQRRGAHVGGDTTRQGGLSTSRVRAEVGTGRAPAAPPLRPPRASALRYVVGAAAVLGIATGAFFWMRATPSPPPPPASSGPQQQVQALTEALVETQLEMAGKRLTEKNYSGALAQAERALKLDPSSARARDLAGRAREALDGAATAAAEARSAAAQGDDARAAEAYFRVLTIDPNHPVAEELAERLDGSSRAQAETARVAMSESRGQAETAKATTLEGFALGAAFSRDGEALFRRGAFASATRAFLRARDAYDGARRQAGR